jgi:hypothetical protein
MYCQTGGLVAKSRGIAQKKDRGKQTIIKITAQTLINYL